MAGFAGSGLATNAFLLLAIFVVPIWALIRASSRQHAILSQASHEQRVEWREASEGKVKRLDVPWRSGPSGGAGLQAAEGDRGKVAWSRLSLRHLLRATRRATRPAPPALRIASVPHCPL